MWRVGTSMPYLAAIGMAGCAGMLDSSSASPADGGADADAPAQQPGSDASLGVEASPAVDGEADDGGGESDDAGCSALGPVPDGAARTFYGSCVPALVPNEGICNDYGYTGDLGATTSAIATQKMVCANLKGTWTDGPCDLSGAVFGCENVESGGFVCATVSVTWFYPPHTTADESSFCPSGAGTVIFP